MSKKFLVNNIHHCVDDFLVGLLYSNPNLSQIEGFTVVVRKDYQEVKQQQVTLLSGGGSGHEPAHAGYIGDGMLTGAVLGNIFASPSVASILAAIRTVGGSHGVLLVVKNYTGDRLNFGMAMELAKQEGINCMMVIVDEDCALAPGKGITGGRGLAGTVLVHKIAGAAAKLGYSLAEVHAVAVKAVKSMKTLGLALSTCTIPGTTPSNRLDGPRSIEVGMGIHGEPGREKSELPATNAAQHIASVLVSGVLTALQAFIVLHQPNTSDKKIKVVLLLNNLGALPTIEFGIMLKEVVEAVLQQSDFEIVRIYSGPFMTSLDMNGLSVTVLSLIQNHNDTLLPLLDLQTTAPGWQMNAYHYHNPILSVSNRTIPYNHTAEVKGSSKSIKHYQQQQQQHSSLQLLVDRKLYAVTRKICEKVIAHEATISEYDQICGDGDCGLVLRKGCEAILELLVELEQEHVAEINIIQFLNMIADTISASMGGTSGVLLELFFRAMSNYLTEKYRKSGSNQVILSKKDWIEAFDKGIEAIQFYGGAQAGMRTMLDALIPASTQLKTDENIVTASQKAKEGVELTKAMEGLAGRSNYINREIMKDTPDPGAYAIALALEELANHCI